MNALAQPDFTRPVLLKMVAFAMTARPNEARDFYTAKLGFRFVKDDGFALVFDANGTMLRVAKATEWKAPHYTILGWEVEDIATTAARLRDRGIAFERYPGMPQDENAICTFPSGDRVAWFKDADGNVLSLSQHVSTE